MCLSVLSSACRYYLSLPFAIKLFVHLFFYILNCSSWDAVLSLRVCCSTFLILTSRLLTFAQLLFSKPVNSCCVYRPLQDFHPLASSSIKSIGFTSAGIALDLQGMGLFLTRRADLSFTNCDFLSTLSKFADFLRKLSFFLNPFCT